MKEPRYGPFIVLGGLTLVLAGGMYYFADSTFTPKIKEAHTGSLISHLERIVSAEGGPGDVESLIEVLPSHGIDWNSCRLEDGVVYDGWGNAIELLRDREAGGWTFRSAGEDGEIGSSDDIASP